LTGFRKFKGRIDGFPAEGEVDFFGWTFSFQIVLLVCTYVPLVSWGYCGSTVSGSFSGIGQSSNKNRRHCDGLFYGCGPPMGSCARGVSWGWAEQSESTGHRSHSLTPHLCSGLSPHLASENNGDRLPLPRHTINRRGDYTHDIFKSAPGLDRWLKLNFFTLSRTLTFAHMKY
jgi:hypothetical protein